MAESNTTIPNKKPQPGKKLFAVIALLIAANILAWFFYGQIDLTKDKRYTITDATTNMLKHLDTKMEVLLFLDGEKLPAPFQRLSNSTQTMLQHFREISDNKITYRVIDPLGSDTTAIQILEQYHMSGIPVTIDDGKKGSAQKMLFPWALVSYINEKGEHVGYPVFLQQTNTPNLSRTTLLRSEILLEYNLANGIHQLSKKDRTPVAYLTGNDEQFDPHIGTMMATLSQVYQFDTLNIDMVNIIPAQLKSVIIQRPLKPFNEQQKFKLDQYVMNGGHILWSLNTATGTLDSLFGKENFNSMPIETGLNDLLFSYGIRINTNLIEDAVNHAFIPLRANSSNAETTMFPWIYFPVLNSNGNHPIVNNLNGVLTRFVSNIDTVGGNGTISKTPLLTSSKYSKMEAVPTPIILESALVPPNPAEFPSSNLTGAILLEGKFNSFYSSHRSVELSDWIAANHIPIKDNSADNGKMIVVSDADIFTNEYGPSVGPSDLGMFAPDPKIQFDNKTFLLNCMEYLSDDDNLLAARNKNFDNRILDPKIVESEKSKWQFINIVIPIAAILIFGAVFFFIRKKKYA